MALKQVPTILIPVRYYVPAYKTGGPVRTLEAMIQHLDGEFSLKVITSCHDMGEHVPFAGIRVGAWHRVGAAEVLYLSLERHGSRGVVQAIRETPHDLLYLNSFFDPAFTLAPALARRLGRLGGQPAVLAPRGELSPGALAQKPAKKALFMRAARLLNLYRGIQWHASTELERAEILAALGRRGWRREALPIHVARDLAALDGAAAYAGEPKRPGQLRAVFISRISPKKNLAAAIACLAGVQGEVSLDIYGAIDDAPYWAACQGAAQSVSGRLRVAWRGALRHEAVLATFARYDVFIFPTLGENFGHVILEALLAGCPVVTSDRTPWRDLATRQAGWDLPLEAPARWTEVMQGLADQDEAAQQQLRQGARALGQSTLDDRQAIEDNRQLFRNALAGAPPARRLEFESYGASRP